MSYPFFQINPFFLLILMLMEELERIKEQLAKRQAQPQPYYPYVPYTKPIYRPQPKPTYSVRTTPIVIRQPTVRQTRTVIPTRKPVMIFRTDKRTFLGV